MKDIEAIIKYALIFVVAFMLLKFSFRFLGFLLLLAARTWYLMIPLVVIVYLIHSSRKKNKINKSSTLDPVNEVKLDKEPEIKDIEEEEK